MTKSFPTKAAAAAWARALEAQIDTADLSPAVRELRTMTVADLLDRYEQEVWPAAGSVDTEIGCFMKPEVAYTAKTIWA